MKRVIVVGGSGTVGRSVVRVLAASGAQVAFTFCRNEGVARELVEATSESEGGAAIARRLDLVRVDDVERVLAALAVELGGVDALVHTAAVGSTLEPQAFEPIDEVLAEGFDRLMAVNVRSAFFAVKALKPALAAAGGNVVLVGSIDGVKSVPSLVAYAASKAALVGMATSLAKELGPSGIRVNVIAPGILEDGVSRGLPAELMAEYLKHCALKRTGTIAEVADVISFFALENTYVSGQTIVLDGGL
jgi:NAD(P)-dependent dehydrogenase (short-subunit alcohol dehydrogenase family)